MAVNKIEIALKEALKKAMIKCNFVEDYEIDQITIEIPKEKSHGDYSTNIAMQLTRLLRKNPRMIAEELIEAIDKKEANIDSIEIAGPGFINMFMKKDALTSIIKEVLEEKDDYGKSDAGKGIKYNVEFVSANPTGDLHLGHAKGAAVGDSICRIMSAAGYDVTREYYINDAGNQIYNLALSLYARYREAFGLDFELPEDGYHGQDIKDIAVKIKEEIGDKYLNADHDEMIAFFRKEGTKFELQKIKDILAEFRVKFDVWFSETSLYEENKVVPTIEKLKEKGFTYEQDGALWFKSTEFGDDKDRVLIKSDGSYTYLTPDIAYHLNKLDRGYEYLVDLLGADHHGYINRMKAAIQALGYNSDQLNIDILQMVRMMENGEVVKISNTKMKIRIALPEDLKGFNKYEVVYISNDEIKETIPATVEDGYIIFETSHLSQYGIIATNVEGKTEQTKNETNNPKTGDNITTSIMLFVASIATIGTLTLVNRKKARK